MTDKKAEIKTRLACWWYGIVFGYILVKACLEPSVWYFTGLFVFFALSAMKIFIVEDRR